MAHPGLENVYLIQSKITDFGFSWNNPHCNFIHLNVNVFLDVCLIHLHCVLEVLNIPSAGIYHLSSCCACRILPKICESSDPLVSAYSCQCSIAVWFRKRRTPQRFLVRTQELCFTECGNC